MEKALKNDTKINRRYNIMMTKNTEISLIKFLSGVPTRNASPEHLFNIWSQVYDTTSFTEDDNKYILELITLYKSSLLKKGYEKEYFLTP